MCRLFSKVSPLTPIRLDGNGTSTATFVVSSSGPFCAWEVGCLWYRWTARWGDGCPYDAFAPAR